MCHWSSGSISILGDNTATATEWLEAADYITLPADVSYSFLPAISRQRPQAGQRRLLHGDALRPSAPSVTELMIRRAGAISAMEGADSSPQAGSIRHARWQCTWPSRDWTPRCRCSGGRLDDAATRSLSTGLGHSAGQTARPPMPSISPSGLRRRRSRGAGRICRLDPRHDARPV